jgi:hypothetical protein
LIEPLTIGAITVEFNSHWKTPYYNYDIEQPVGYFGLAEYFFRHPEQLVGLAVGRN